MKPIYIMGAIALTVMSCSRKKETDTSNVQRIEVAEATTDSVTLYNTYPGYLTASRAIDVVGRVNGQIVTKNYDDGAFVKKGQVLFTIESTQYADRVNEAKAQLATAQSNYEYNKQHCEAIKKAYESDAVSAMEVAQAESALKQSAAAIKNAEAQLSTAQLNLGYCTVVAPVSGHITSPIYNPGSYIGGEGAPVTLCTIYDDIQLNAVFTIEDEQYVSMLKDSPAEREELKTIPLKFSESLPHDYTANLYYMAPSIDRTTGSMTLQASLDNKYGELKSGMFVSISLPVGSDPKAVVVNDASISTDQLGKYLYVVNDSDMVVYTPIKVGDLANDSMRIVTSGIAPGEKYVTKALLKVRNGMKVIPELTK